jgi:hypothetical protein
LGNGGFPFKFMKTVSFIFLSLVCLALETRAAVTLNYNTNDFTFEAGVTYHITGPVTISGTTTIQGGAVVKYAKLSSAKLVLDVLNCQTDVAHPAVFTADDDDSVGEVISGSTGSPSGIYAEAAMEINHDGNVSLQNVRIAYAGTGLSFAGNSGYDEITVRNAELVHCPTAIFTENTTGNLPGRTLLLTNVLVVDCVGQAFAGYEWSGIMQNVTVDNCVSLFLDWGTDTGRTIYLYDSILANIGETGNCNLVADGNYNGFYNCVGGWCGAPLSPTFGVVQYTNTTPPFQAGMAGDHYLVTNATFINAGNATAATFGLYYYTTQTNQTKEAGSTVDLGYHYVALDANGNPPKVTVCAVDPFSFEGGSWGEFSIALPEPAGAGGVTVNFTLSGANNNGTVYGLISPTSVTIPFGSLSAEVFIVPVNDTTYTGLKTITLALTTATGYLASQIDTQPATVILVDDDPPAGIYASTAHPVVTITATDADAREDTTQSSSVRNGTFQVTRSDDPNDPNDLKQPLTVKFHLSGTATYGVDYDPIADPVFVTIPANQVSTTIVITPADDSIVETVETVVATLQPGPKYDLGTPASATINIDDKTTNPALIEYTVKATDFIAVEPMSGGYADAATYTITRLGSALNAATIYYNTNPATASLAYTYTGTATLGTDYDVTPPRNPTVPGPIVFPAGVSTATVTVLPLWENNNPTESTETVILTVTNTGHANSADTAFIFDSHNAAPSPLSVTTVSPSVKEGSQTEFKFNRLGTSKGLIPVVFRLDGQANPDTDYTLGGNGLITLSPRVRQVTIPDLNSSTLMTLTATSGSSVRGVESVIITIIPSSSTIYYQIGTPYQVALRIRESNSTKDYVPDTDHDGIDDMTEVGSSPPTDALIPDTDGDGLLDGFVSNQTGDANGDGVSNGAERTLFSLPGDSDGDLFSDFEELLRGIDPSVVNTITDTQPPVITVTSPTSPKITTVP